MALRAKKPEMIEKRLKALFYGNAGVGKTTAAINFPAPYLIDTERGSENTQYVETLKKSGGAIFQTSDFDEMLTEVKALLTEKHNYKTLIIDPMTVLYNDLVEKCISFLKNTSKEKNSTGTEFGRHNIEADKRMKNLYSLLLRLDMNVIVTSHAKKEYGDNMVTLGSTFDCHKKLDYLFDLVFEIQKRGKERVGVIKKSRIEGFPDGETFPFSYAEIAQRYGKEVLERDSCPEKLATQEEVDYLKHLVDLYKEPQETIDKWLTKSNAETFEEMNQEIILKLISHMESKSKPKGVAA